MDAHCLAEARHAMVHYFLLVLFLFLLLFFLFLFFCAYDFCVVCVGFKESGGPACCCGGMGRRISEGG